MPSIRKNPFKFLDSYKKEDIDLFFGRSQEVEALYKMLFRTNLVLVYGASGTGKTSLIQCGLVNRFDEASWLELFVRREENINEALSKKLDEKAEELHLVSAPAPNMDWFDELITASATLPVEKEKTADPQHSLEVKNPIIEKVKGIYLQTFKPVYLIFDQFEELFTLGTEEEKTQFYELIQELIEVDFPCKILLSMREEYLAQLYELEKSVKALYENRLRIEVMSPAKAKGVVEKIFHKENIQTEKQANVIGHIIDIITDQGKEQVQLPFLQVLLGQLFDTAISEQDIRTGPVIFNMDLFEKMNLYALSDLLNGLLEDQLVTFQEDKTIRKDRNFALAFLRILVTKQGTKAPLSRQKIFEALRSPVFNDELINECIDFFTKNRMLRLLANDQVELVHDSLAKRIFEEDDILFRIPDAPEQPIPDNFFDLEDYPFTERLCALFFGREKELLFLYNKLAFQLSRLTILYGNQGVGKTTLIKAGLIPRLKVAGYEVDYFSCNDSRDWEKLGKTIRKYLRAERSEKLSILVIDHLESGQVRGTAIKGLFQDLKQMMNIRLGCRVLIAIDKKSLADLFDYEHLFSSILDNRVYLQPMADKAINTVVKKIVSTLGEEISHPEEITEKLPGSFNNRNLDRLLRACKEYYLDIRRSKLGPKENITIEKGTGGKEAVVMFASLSSSEKRAGRLEEEYWQKRAVERLIEGNEAINVIRLFMASLQVLIKNTLHYRDQIVIYNLFTASYEVGLTSQHEEQFPKEALFNLFRNTPNLKLFVTNEQYLIKPVLETVDPVILYTPKNVDGQKAGFFQEQFYKALQKGMTIREAFQFSKAAVLTRYSASNIQEVNIRRLETSNLESLEEWGMYCTDEKKLAWRLPHPSSAVSDIGETSPHLAYAPNKLLIDVLSDSMREFVKESALLHSREDSFEHRMALLQAFPLVISEPLRKLFVTVQLEGIESLKALEKLVHVYDATIRYADYIFLAQLNDAILNKLGQDITSDKRLQILFRSENDKPFSVIRNLMDLFEEHEVDLFVEEFHRLSSMIKTEDDSIINSAIFLKDLQLKLTNKQIDADFAALYIKGEKSLSDLLSKFAFLSKYKLVSVKKIELKKGKSLGSPQFVHTFNYLEEGFFTEINKQLSLPGFTDSGSVLLLNSKLEDAEPKYLNLSPFLIDDSTDDTHNVPMPYMLARVNNVKDGVIYGYYSILFPDEQLEIGEDESLDGLRRRALEEWQFFTSLLNGSSF